MTKEKLTELAKARVGPTMKQNLEQLTLAFEYEDEADTIRRALRDFIEANRHALPQSRDPVTVGARPVARRNRGRVLSPAT